MLHFVRRDHCDALAVAPTFKLRHIGFPPCVADLSREFVGRPDTNENTFPAAALRIPFSPMRSASVWTGAVRQFDNDPGHLLARWAALVHRFVSRFDQLPHFAVRVAAGVSQP